MTSPAPAQPPKDRGAGHGRGPAAAVAATLAVAAGLVLFHYPILFRGSLDAYDWQTHIHYFEWIQTALRNHHTLPLYLPVGHRSLTNNLVGHPEFPLGGPLVWLLWLISAQAYVKTLLVTFSTVGCVSMWALARDMGATTAVAFVPAVAFALNGFVLAHFVVGHYWALGVFLMPLAALLFRRAVLGSRRALVAGAFVNLLLLLEGHHHPLLWQSVLVGGWAICWSVGERSWRPARVLAMMAGLSIGLGAVRLLPAFFALRGYAPPESFPGVAPSQLLRALSTGGPRFSVGSGWSGMLEPFIWEADASIGVLGLILSVVGASAARRSHAWPFVIVAVAALVASTDFGQGAWSAFGQRVPGRLLVITVFCLLAAAPLGLERLRSRLASAVSNRRMLVVVPFLVIAAAVVGERWAETRSWESYGAGVPPAPATWDVPPPRVIEGIGRVASRDQPVGQPLNQPSPLPPHPNQVAFEAEAVTPMRVLLPLRSRSSHLEWWIDGFDARAEAGFVAVRVPPGHHHIAASFTPQGLSAGLLVTVATLGGCILWAMRRRRTAKLSPPSPLCQDESNTGRDN